MKKLNSTSSLQVITDYVNFAKNASDYWTSV